MNKRSLMYHSIRIVLIGLLALLGTSLVSAQQVAIKTNGLMLLAGTPNLGCELVTGEHTSMDLSVFGHYNPYGLNSKLIGIQPEYRFWFNGRPMTREYIGIAALAATYDMHFGENVYDGDAVGFGVTAGYSLSLGKRLNLEFYGGFGAVIFWQKQYYKNDNYEDAFIDGSIKTNANGYKLLPIKLGVSISYILK